jgi:SAM-dependent methyltransferase
LERLAQDAGPLKGKKVLVLCSAAGDVAFYLAEQVGPNGTVIGLELNEALRQHARLESHKRNVSIEFRKAEMYSIPFPDESFDALISTDVIVTKPLSEEARAALRAIGLDYLCEATPEDFREWMGEAGLVDVEIHDWTPLLRQVWEQRRVSDREPGHRAGYTLLLEDQDLRLGEAIFYLYVRGRKPA